MRHRVPDRLSSRLDHIRARERFLYDNAYTEEPYDSVERGTLAPSPFHGKAAITAIVSTLFLVGTIVIFSGRSRDTPDSYSAFSVAQEREIVQSISPLPEPAFSAARNGDNQSIPASVKSSKQIECSGKGLDLCESDTKIAETAWKYFENNSNPNTGLVNSIDQYPSTTMWDTGSSLGAYIAARDFNLISQYDFDQTIMNLLKTMSTMDLFEGLAPNIVYSTETAAMIDYSGNEIENGIGVSVLDLSRLAYWATTLQCMHPKYYNPVNKILSRWNFSYLVKDEQLYGIAREDSGTGEMRSVQQGRLGYEQYAGKVYQSLGFNAAIAANYDNAFRANTEILGFTIAHDNRDPRQWGVNNFVVTDSYTLDAMEHGIDEQNQPLLENIFKVQKKRWQDTGIPTAISDDNINQPPYYLYNTIFSAGLTFTTTTDTGVAHEALKTVSTKSAFSLATLFPHDDYSNILMSTIESAYNPDRGWYSGIYEEGGYNDVTTAHTNGVMLTTLLYKKYGAMPSHCQAFARKTLIDSPLLSSIEP